MASIELARHVEWSETDASGHYHHIAAFRMFEEAETRLLRSLGMLDDVYARLPRVHFSVDFLSRLEFFDRVTVRAEVERLGRSSIHYRFAIRSGARECVRGGVVAVLTDPDTGRPVPWSLADRERLQGPAHFVWAEALPGAEEGAREAPGERRGAPAGGRQE